MWMKSTSTQSLLIKRSPIRGFADLDLEHMNQWEPVHVFFICSFQVTYVDHQCLAMMAQTCQKCVLFLGSKNQTTKTDFFKRALEWTEPVASLQTVALPEINAPVFKAHLEPHYLATTCTVSLIMMHCVDS